MTCSAWGDEIAPSVLSGNHAMLRLNTAHKYLLLPVEERTDNDRLTVIVGGRAEQTLNVRLATTKADYYVPLELSAWQGKDALLDLHISGSGRDVKALSDIALWKLLKYSDTFDTSNRERLRPLYHHTPLYGWMNDPNGMFYAGGKWHLYYQYNPYGSLWENMSWGHAVSSDLVHWKEEPIALRPDALGTVFSGSCVVDSANVSGYGAGAVLSFYTAAGESQTQCVAVSRDGGMTFTRYPGNPVITGDVPDFRDPKVFRDEERGRWGLVLAAGQEVRFYASEDLLHWRETGRFGKGYGSHGGVWECPDMVRMKVRGTGESKWLLIVNIGDGGPNGGSATQYFIGDFDGSRFVPEGRPEDVHWMDYGKDHYATVTFSGAPDGRHVALAWMSNWQYASAVPTRQYRSANSIARNLSLVKRDGSTALCVEPAPEMLRARKPATKQLTTACEITAALRGSGTITFSNAGGENLRLIVDSKAGTITLDRTRSAIPAINDRYASRITAPLSGGRYNLRLFLDRTSLEVFDADGTMAMTNIIFPTAPYTDLSVTGSVKTRIYPID